MVDKAFDATGASGVAYGAAFYRQRLHDGIKLMLEVDWSGW